MNTGTKSPLKDWKMFQSLPPEEQKQIFKDFEKRIQDWLDINFYPDLGKIIDRRGTFERDLVLWVKNGKVSIEEKIRSNVWDDFLIEIMQDITPPLTKAKIGWFYLCRAERLMVVFCESLEATEPKVIYSVNMPKFKKMLPELIEAGVNYEFKLSLKGKGLTLNMIISWDILELNQIAIKMYP